MPIGHGPKRYFFLKSLFQLIDSLSVFHAAVLLSACIYPPVMTWHWVLCGWSMIELVFYAWFHKELFERQASNEFTMSDEQRRVFIEQSMLHLKGYQGAEDIAKWFFWKDTQIQLNRQELKYIQQDNLIEWIGWAFYNLSDIETINHSNCKSEIVDFIHKIMGDIGLSFKPGKNSDIQFVHVNFNRVEASPKPFLLYLVFYLLDLFGSIIFYQLYFKKHSLPMEDGKRFEFWIRHGHLKNQTPLVIFHGMGIGKPSYLHFLTFILGSHPNIPIFFVEIPHVSLKLVKADQVYVNQSCALKVKEMLLNHGFEKAHFMGHSLGTIYCTWMCKYVSEMIESCIFVDPVCFNYFDPTLISHFVYRSPKRANEYLIHWLLSRELNVSHYISRQFQWYENMILEHEIPAKSHVFISEDDNLINGTRLANYLEGYSIPLTFWKHEDHGAVLFKKGLQTDIVQVLNEFTSS